MQTRDFLLEVEKKKHSLYACLKDAVVSPPDGAGAAAAVTVTCAKKYSSDFVSRGQAYLETVITKHVGKKMKLQVVLEEAAQPAPAEPPPEAQTAADDSEIKHPEDDPSVQDLLKVFPGKIII